MNNQRILPLRKMLSAALFTALLIVATQFNIPLGPVPITMQPFVVMFAGLVLGGFWGAASVGLWALLGFIGLPVFAGGKAGIAVLFGPTGGFIVGFIVGAFLIGILSENRQLSFRQTVATLLLGLLLTYTIGLGGFLFNMNYFVHKPLTLQQGLNIAVFPFVLWDIAKALLAAYVGRKVKHALRSMERHRVLS